MKFNKEQLETLVSNIRGDDRWACIPAEVQSQKLNEFYSSQAEDLIWSHEKEAANKAKPKPAPRKKRVVKKLPEIPEMELPESEEGDNEDFKKLLEKSKQ